MSESHVVYLIKGKIDGKYLCKNVILIADTMVELTLKIKQLIRREASENYCGSIFYVSPRYYVTDKLGKVLVQTAQEMKQLIQKI